MTASTSAALTCQPEIDATSSVRLWPATNSEMSLAARPADPANSTIPRMKPAGEHVAHAEPEEVSHRFGIATRKPVRSRAGGHGESDHAGERDEWDRTPKHQLRFRRRTCS